MTIIYEPSGRAKEYCTLAANLYRGCGLSKSAVAYSPHHIIKRSQGGDDTPENLISLCYGPGSNTCHEKADAKRIAADVLRDLKAMCIKQGL